MRVTAVIGLLLSVLCSSTARGDFASEFEITSGGLPTMTGSLGGSISVSPNTTQSLMVTLNLGELSPANRNGIVKVVIPIAIRSKKAYQVIASASGSLASHGKGVLPSDIALGVTNLRPLGSKAAVCMLSPHRVIPPFDNDPSTSRGRDSNGRVVYRSSLADLTIPTAILSGPKSVHGYRFDATVAVTPQYYSAGSFSTTLMFTIYEGPSVPCRGDEDDEDH